MPCFTAMRAEIALMSGSAFAVTHHAFSSGAGRTSDGNGSHASTLKSPSYTKSVSWQHYPLLKQQAQNWQPGHPLDPATTMGTLIDSAHADSVHTFIREGEGKGQLLLDGRNAGLAAAIGPTIFVDVDPNASLSREEIFGPVLVVTRFTSEDQALQLANDSQYGLGAAVWTRDLSRAHRMSRRLKAGSVFVNNYNDGDMTVPFGGYKQSGNGRDKSLHALEKFTELKTIWISLET
ncbi:aldehyde dehydrogenase family protein [Shigella flexneri SFJ17B]|nr:aldehyde dehydrogenase family protein [Shigella flexneri SFJ17B]